VSLPDSAPPVCHVEESEGSNISGTGSTSSDSTRTLSPDHPLTCDTPALVLSLRRTARMAVRAQPVLSPGYSARIAEATAMSDVAFRKSEGDELEDEEVEDSLYSDSRSEDAEDEGPTIEDEDPVAEDEGLTARVEGPSMDDEGYGLDDESRGIDDEGHSQAAPVVGTIVSTPLDLGYEALRLRELALEEDKIYSTFEVGQGSGSTLEFERPERVSAFRHPTLTTWTDPKDGMIYIDVPDYPPPAPPVQTPPSPN
ncbi:hypothetical protein Tco_1064374, partial [Tanacetum coccineum]